MKTTKTETFEDEFEKAAKDLEAVLAKAEKPAPATEAELKAAAEALEKADGGDKGAQGELVVGGKHKETSTSKAGQPADNRARRGGKNVDEGEDGDGGDDDGDGDGEKKGGGAKDTLYKALTEGEEWQDVAPQLETLAAATGLMGEAIVKSIRTENAALRAETAALRKSLGVICRALLEIHKGVGGLQAKPTPAGIIGKIGDRVIQSGGPEKREDANGHGLSRGAIQVRLEKAIQDEKLTPDALERFARWGDTYLKTIPPEVAKSYGLPQPEAG